MTHSKLFNTKKSLGQHFLVDIPTIDQIIRLSNINGKDIVEIGPGNGSLTTELVKHAKTIVAIEKDVELVPFLNNLKLKYTNFDYIVEDALKLNPIDLKNQPSILISNLPYNVGTEIYLKYLHFNFDNNKKQFEYLILMFQLEVAKRIVANVGDRNYGRLSIISKLLANCEILLDVDKNCFNPAPKVQSAVIKVSLLDKPRYDVNLKKLQLVTAMAFNGRRKTIKNSLQQLNLNLEEIGINFNKRAEELTLEEFCLIANNID
jgi:16S rRNA (adenine1518-N6/adenine1519-N6)-dimethyltransferase